MGARAVDRVPERRSRWGTRGRTSTDELGVPAGLFVLIGSTPRTAWLPASVQRDEAGFVRTGERVAGRGGAAGSTLPSETSLPGVFAIGDVRAGSVKRVATAVGDGATVISTLHGYLAAHPAPAERSVSGAAGAG